MSRERQISSDTEPRLGPPEKAIRYRALRFLNEKPASISEIMSELDWTMLGGITSGGTLSRCRPHPELLNSELIHVTLESLVCEGYVTAALEREQKIRRYSITDRGREFCREHVRRTEEFKEKYGELFARKPRPPFC